MRTKILRLLGGVPSTTHALATRLSVAEHEVRQELLVMEQDGLVTDCQVSGLVFWQLTESGKRTLHAS